MIAQESQVKEFVKLIMLYRRPHCRYDYYFPLLTLELFNTTHFQVRHFKCL
uniref:Uncharacterized protein n=1 Tax=Arundo donax TaxID=35708 RepID=A0A0A9DNZ2_ARUDO